MSAEERARRFIAAFPDRATMDAGLARAYKFHLRDEIAWGCLYALQGDPEAQAAYTERIGWLAEAYGEDNPLSRDHRTSQ
jgi:hypothetical protein